MQVIKVAPSPRLAPFVRAFTIVETTAEATRVLLPETGLFFGLRYRGASDLIEDSRVTRMPNAVLTGVGCAVRQMRTAPQSGIVLVLFRETGAVPFFPGPLHETFGRSRSCEEWFPASALARVEARLAGAAGAAERVALVEEFLLGHLRPARPDPVVDAAVGAIQTARGSIRIRPLARDLGISQDPLEKRFRRVVGASPKQLASLVRLRRVIADHRPGLSLGRLAHEAGYCDQSHFIRDFRAFTGSSPERFLRSVAFC